LSADRNGWQSSVIQLTAPDLTGHRGGPAASYTTLRGPTDIIMLRERKCLPLSKSAQ
jgi:hypothetical protein